MIQLPKPSKTSKQPRQLAPNGFLQDNYPRNMWWVAARCDEVTLKPMARWLLELPVVLYRTASGEPVALDNRCPHRWAPLSEGRVEGDEIVCPYHGMRFGVDGACTHVPTQDRVPETACVASYPLRESGAFIWIWMGDPDLIEASDPPVDLSYTTRDDWTILLGYYCVAANWVLIRENVLDLTHIAHLHTKTFKQNDWNTLPDVKMDGDVVIYQKAFEAAPLSPLFCHAMGLSETKPVERVQTGTMASLAVSFSDWQVHDPNPEPGARSDFLARGCHIVTPARRGETHYYWGAAFDIADVPDEVAEKSKANVIEAFNEDKYLLEAMQAQLSTDPRGANATEVNLGADGASMRVRMVLNRKLEAEGRSLKADG